MSLRVAWFHINVPNFKTQFVLIFKNQDSVCFDFQKSRLRLFWFSKIKTKSSMLELLVVKIHKTCRLRIWWNQSIRMWSKSTLGYLNTLIYTFKVCSLFIFFDSNLHKTGLKFSNFIHLNINFCQLNSILVSAMKCIE